MKKLFYNSGLLTLIIIIYSISGYGIILSESVAGENNSEIRTPKSEIRYVAAEGKVETLPGLEVDVGSEITGRIEKVYVNEGDRVKKGQVIAKLSNRDIEAKQKEAETELEVAKSRLREVASGSRAEEIKMTEANYEAAVADMELAKKNLERYELLFRDDVIPKAMLDERENAFRVASSRMKAAEEEKILTEKGPKEETLRLLEDSVKKAEASVEYFKRVKEKTLITAPISGKVIHKNLFEGEMITEDFSILTIADVEKIRINAEVDETDIALIHIKDPVDITSDAYRGKVFKGEIEEIAGYAGERNIRPNNPAKNLAMKIIKVKIRLLEKTPFKLGMTVDVRIKPVMRTPSPP